MKDDSNIHVSAKELRRNLKKYLDMVDRGQKVTIIRDSIILGKIVPDEAIQAAAEKREKRAKEYRHPLSDGRQLRIRQLKLYEDSEKVRQLHREAMESVGAYCEPQSHPSPDLMAPALYYPDYGGEFWIGEVDGELVAMGGFKHWDHAQGKPIAQIKRMRVKPGLQGQGIGRRMLAILEERARLTGFTEAVLNTTDRESQAPARHLYQSHGYQEYDRRPRDDHNVVLYRKPL